MRQDDGEHQFDMAQTRCAELETQKDGQETQKDRPERRNAIIVAAARVRVRHGCSAAQASQLGKRRSASGASTRLSALLLARIFEQF